MKSSILALGARAAGVLLKGLPGILVWWFFAGYLLDGLNWRGPVLLAALLAGSLLGGVLSIWWLGRLNLDAFLEPLRSARRTTLLLALGLLGLVAALGFVFPQPVFPAIHTLTVCAPAQTDPALNPFVVYRVAREDGVSVSLSEMKGEDPWNLENTALVAQAGGACASYREFFKGGLVVSLREAPGMGRAQLTWDGQTQTISLDAAREDIRKINLPGDRLAETSLVRRAAAMGMRVARAATAGGLALGLALAFQQGGWGAGPLRRDNLWLCVGLLAVLGLLAAGQLGRSAAVAADDYCYSGSAARSGLIGGTRVFYTTINGRLLGNFMGVLSGGFFPYQPLPHAVFLILGLWVAALMLLLAGLLRWLTGQRQRLLALQISALVVLVTLIAAPDVYQSLYWRSGREPLVFPLILYALLAALVLAAAQAKKPLRRGLAVAGLAVGALAAGAFHEAYAAIQVAMFGTGLALALVYGRWAGRQPGGLLAGLALGLVGALGGLLVHVLSPGTAERASALGVSFNPVNVIYGALYEGNAFMFGSNLNVLTLGLFVLGLALSTRLATPETLPDARNLTALWLALPLVLWAGVVAAFAVGFYGLGAVLPPRTQILPTFLGVLAAPLWGLLSGAELLRRAPELARGPWLRPAQALAVTALGIAFVFHAHTMMSQRPIFDRYAIAVTVMTSTIQEARAAGADRVTVNRLPPNPYQVTNPEVASPNFVNGCINHLFGLPVDFK